MLPVNARPSLFAAGSVKRIVAAAVVVGVGAGIPVVAATAANAAPVKSAPAHSAQAAAPQAPAGYTVRSGDSLTKIATAHNVQGGWRKLYDLNKSVLTGGPNKIYPGQHLTLGAAAPTKAPAAPAPAAAPAKTAAASPLAATPVANTPAALQALAASIVPANQLASFDQIISHESGWNIHATNPSSGAYGLPQALPGNKMASAGSDWQNNPATQLKWALQYMNTVYGSPNAAWAFWQVHNAY
ncbi:LysM peptidoglycan-binding domain-containing protein [Kitasatospora sp. NPDC004669]|uniref:LysM peptidoglycan-binding domain-containing protein n=1 Tax=Kitasatospora sp. NPDC004669 TaxID=3154555 RepID=UPI0033A01488